MTKLEELIKELCPNGVEHVELKEIGPVCMCKRILKSQTTSNGEVPFYKIGTFGGRANSFISHELYEEYKSKYNFPNKGDILISAAGTIGKLVIYNGEPAYFQDSNIVWIKNSEEKALNKYLYYCYETAPWVASTGGTIARLYNENIERAKIPLPPLAVQREIVRILDKFTLYSQELAAELAARKKQYEFYRDKLLSFDNLTNGGGYNLNNLVRIVKLGEIATDVYRGSGITREQVVQSGTPCVRYGEIYTTYHVWFDRCVSYADPAVLQNPKYFEHGDILFAITGESVEDIAKSVAYVGHDKCLAGGDIVVMKHKQNPKYLAYALSTFAACQQKSKGKIKSKVVHSNVPSILNIEIPLPPLEVQKRIVKVLDNFDAICSDLGIGLPAEIEKRQQQYEFYRDATIFTDRQTDRAD